MSAPVLEIDQLSLEIGGRKILRGVSVTVAPGEIVALVGESGSGKSMTLLATLGLAPAAAKISGAVLFKGEALLGAGERRMTALRGAGVGMVFQEPATALNPVQTLLRQVAETVLLHRRASRAEADALALASLARVGLSAAQAARFPHQVSGGQRQRAAIAIATVLAPQILLADEPTTALDVTTQAQIMQLLQKQVREAQTGLLLVTHDLGLVASVADRIAIMKEGEIVEQGSSPDLLRGLQHSYSQDLLRASLVAPRAARRAAGAPLLEVRDVRVSYALKSGRTVRAIDGVSFALPEGESLAIVGESGSGKSSLARAILGLEKIAGCAVHLGGVSAAHLKGPAARAYRRQVQIVLQDPFGSFDPRWRVEDIVAEPFHVLDDKPSAAERRVGAAKALGEVGLASDALRRFPHEFSGGQRQRIAIARALITAPKLVVLDEALSALDVSTRANILALLAELQAKRGLSYLFITHDLAVVPAIADRVLVLKAGKIVEQGDVPRIFAAPEHAYTKALLEATPRLDAILARS
ncbi:MAG: dipeptide ABC transporter ATP-binding protein [Terricaulis sp.]